MKTSLDVVGKFLSGGLHNVFRGLPSDFIEVWLLVFFFFFFWSFEARSKRIIVQSMHDILCLEKMFRLVMKNCTSFVSLIISGIVSKTHF